MALPTLSDSDVEVFRRYLTHDVTYLGWELWSNYVAGIGCCKMGYLTKLLLYKPRPGMPLLRRQLVELHLEIIRERAAEYGLKVVVDDAICKDSAVLYDEGRFPTLEELKEFLETQYDSGKKAVEKPVD